MADVILPYLDDLALYRLAKQVNGQLYVISSSKTANATPGTYSAPTAGSGYIYGIAIETGPEIAFDVYGFAMETFGFVPFGNLPPSDGGESTGQSTIHLTYTQPSPPASNATTLASTAGNLQLRNHFWSQTISVAAAAYNPGTNTTPVYSFVTSQRVENTVLLERPITIVGSQLALSFDSPSWDTGTYTYTGVRLVGRYKKITTSEYVNLVALATGQAILSPQILG